MKKFLFFIAFNILFLPGFAIQVANYDELRDAVNNNINSIEISQDINFGAPLTVSTSTVLSSIANSTFTIQGNDAPAPILTFTNANSSIINIKFSSTTQNNYSSGTIYIDVAAVTPGQAYSTFTIDNVYFSNNLSSTTIAQGGALHINSQQSTGIFNSEFSSNSALGIGSQGGALYYNGPKDIEITRTNFSSNTVEQNGGAIYASTATLRGSYFYGNTALAGNGGAIYASSITISSSSTADNESIKSSFYNNYAEGNGGAIYITKYANINDAIFQSNISTNSANGLGGAIYAGAASTTTISGDFMINRGFNGGAIYNAGNMTVDKAFLNANIALSNGGAIYNTGTMVISTSTFASNRSVANGGAIYTNGNLDIYKSDFSNNIAEGNGGAIYIDNTTVNLYNAMNFINNKSSGTGLGGAIYINNGTLNINPQGQKVIFGGNSDSTGSNDIYMDSSSAVNITGGGTVLFYSGIVGGSLTATDTNLSFYTSNPYDQTLTMTGGTLGLFGYNTNLATVNLTNTAINTQNGSIDNITVSSLNITGSAPIYLDVNPSTAQVDNFSGSVTGTFDITTYDQLNIMADQAGTSADLVIAPGATVNVNTTEDFYGPLYIYNLQPTASSDGFKTVRSNRLNPTISTLPVAANAKTISNMNTTASLYNRIDIMFSRDLLNYVRPEDSQLLDKGPYVDPENPIKKGPVPTQSRNYMAWFIPNGGYQKVDYSGSINDVTNVFYGGLVGIDFPFVIEQDTTFVPTLFAGYLGSKKEYEKVTTHNDSLAFGGMATWQKGKVLLSAQMYITNGPESYSFKNYTGSFDIFSYTASVKVETGINLSDSIIVQPAVMAFYNLSNLQDYTTANGANMQSTRFQNILLTPSLKIMGAYKGWYPYLSFAYNFNTWQKGSIKADDLALPEYKLKSIGELGIGIENTFWKDYSGYVQLSGYLGGSRGLIFQMGLRGYIN